MPYTKEAAAQQRATMYDDADLWPICEHIKGVWIRRGHPHPTTPKSPIFIGHKDKAQLGRAVAAFKKAGFRVVGEAEYPWQGEIQVARPRSYGR